jgi:uncharacterized protein YegJ (DUF2314 family)
MLPRWFNWEAALWILGGALGLFVHLSRAAEVHIPLTAACVGAIGIGIALWANARVGRRIQTSFFIALILYSIYHVYVHGPSLGMAIAVACIGWGIYRNLTTPEEEEANANSPAFVLLLTEQRDPERLHDACLKRVFENALDVRLDASDDGDGFVTGEGFVWIACIRGRFISIINDATPYFEDPPAVARDLPEMRVAHAVREHKACLSLTLVGDHSGEDADASYRILGKMAAALSEPLESIDAAGKPVPPWPTPLAILWPPGSQIRAYDEELRDRLWSDDPLSAFREMHLANPPVIEVHDDDPRMLAAIEEARQRWPEFVRAFEARKPDHTFAVKARIEEGDACEFMWILVERLEGEQISGKINNEPVQLKQVRLGDAWTVERGDVLDWLFTTAEGLQGAFSVKVLEQIQREGKAKK